jgi:hypothetical protein
VFGTKECSFTVTQREKLANTVSWMPSFVTAATKYSIYIKFHTKMSIGVTNFCSEANSQRQSALSLAAEAADLSSIAACTHIAVFP